MKRIDWKKWSRRTFVVLVLGFIFFEFYRWPSAAAETGFILLCESDYVAMVGPEDYSVKYAAATKGRFAFWEKWQVSLVVEPVPDTPPPRKIYCTYDRAGLMQLQDIRSGFVYNRDDA
jgi:hypothetical protein